MDASAVPDDGVERPGGEGVLDRRGERAIEPAPAERARSEIDGKEQIRPLALELEPLGHVRPSWSEHPPHLAAQAQRSVSTRYRCPAV
jgi:hypothetical protein